MNSRICCVDRANGRVVLIVEDGQHTYRRELTLTDERVLRRKRTSVEEVRAYVQRQLDELVDLVQHRERAIANALSEKLSVVIKGETLDFRLLELDEKGLQLGFVWRGQTQFFRVELTDPVLLFSHIDANGLSQGGIALLQRYITGWIISHDRKQRDLDLPRQALDAYVLTLPEDSLSSWSPIPNLSFTPLLNPFRGIRRP